MKISKLLATRHSIIRQAHLASLAHAFATTKRLANRVARVKLRGLVRLQSADPHEERYWPTLTALEGNQSLLEEHFSDEDLIDLADAAVFAIEAEFNELQFRLEDLAEKMVNPLRAALEGAGIVIDVEKNAPSNATAEKQE